MVIAITGGIGSGKSKVIEILETFGANVLSADQINHEIMKIPEYIQKISKNFKGVVKDGEIDRVELGKQVFSDSKLMKKLNDIAHPEIREEITKRIKAIDGTVFVEIPLLVESNMQDNFDRIWLVRASNELRLKRITKRNLLSEEYAKKIMSSQANDKIRKEYATDIIENNGDEIELANRVEQLYKGLYE